MTDGKIIPFPRSNKNEKESSSVSYLRWAAQDHIISLTERRREIEAMRKEIKKIKGKLTLKLLYEDGKEHGKD